MFLSLLAASTLVEKSLPEYVAGDESIVQVCSHMDLLKDVSTDGGSSHLCPVVDQELHRLLDGAREGSVLSSFPTGLIAGSVTNRVLG